MKVPSNNPSFCFPIPLSGATEPFYQRGIAERAAASRNISSPGGSEDRGVLPLNETGGKVDLPSNCDKHSQEGAERGPASFSPRPFLKEKKRKENILAAPALCKDMNILPDKNPLEEPPPRGARMSRSVVRRLLVWLEEGGGSLSAVMKWKSSSAGTLALRR